MKKSSSLFGRLLLVFFGAALLIIIGGALSFKFLAEKPYRKSFNRNIITYTRLIADKMRFDPLAKEIIEKAAGVKIITNRYQIRAVIAKKDLHFRPLTQHISVTKPGRLFYVKYENNFEYFLISVHDQQYHPENVDAVIVALIIAVIILLITYHVVQGIFRPIDRIQKMALQYGQGKFDEKIPVEGKGQLASLTISINDLVDKIKSMLNAKRDLFLAIGHELKTPLARLRMQVEMLDGDNHDLVENINEMNMIINQLIEAERVTHHAELNKEHVEMKDFLSVYVDDTVSFEFRKSCYLKIDPIRVDLVMKNIINNAKKYAGESGKVHIELDGEHKTISITDNGPGVSEETLERLTEAFYRPDESRNRDSGGVGLGLYLVKNIMEAHRGSLEFENANPGLRVILRFQNSEQKES